MLYPLKKLAAARRGARLAACLRTADPAVEERAPEIAAGLASIPSRAVLLEHAVASLLPQVDRLAVFLNGFDRVPGYLEHPRVEVLRSERHGRLEDAGKFWSLDDCSGLYFACDDDIVYPADYVARTRAALSCYRGTAVVGYHGAVFTRRYTTYRRSRLTWEFWNRQRHDLQVHVLGTGAIAIDCRRITLRRGDFQRPNMADVWLALAAQRRSIPLVCLAHPAGWLEELPDPAGGLYRTTHVSDERAALRRAIDRVAGGQRRWRFPGHAR